MTDEKGNYKFENLAAGEYVVQVVPQDGQTLTTKGQGTDTDSDSDVDPKTGITDAITLEPNENITDVDAGIVPVEEYKLDYEFKPSDAEGTPDKLPQGVLDQLPKAQEKLADGKSVPSPKEFTPVKDEVNKGTWTFEAIEKTSDCKYKRIFHSDQGWAYKEFTCGRLDKTIITQDKSSGSSLS